MPFFQLGIQLDLWKSIVPLWQEHFSLGVTFWFLKNLLKGMGKGNPIITHPGLFFYRCSMRGLEWHIRNRVHFADREDLEFARGATPSWSPKTNMLSATRTATCQLCAHASSQGGWRPRYVESGPGYLSFALQLWSTVANQHSFYTWETSMPRCNHHLINR